MKTHCTFTLPLLEECNIPYLCKMIEAEDPIVQEKQREETVDMDSQKNPAVKTKNNNRHPVPKIVEKKFQYDDQELEDNSETHKTESQTCNSSKIRKVNKKPFNL